MANIICADYTFTSDEKADIEKIYGVIAAGMTSPMGYDYHELAEKIGLDTEFIDDGGRVDSISGVQDAGGFYKLEVGAEERWDNKREFWDAVLDQLDVRDNVDASCTVAF